MAPNKRSAEERIATAIAVFVIVGFTIFFVAIVYFARTLPLR